jgi:hypothetical protein
MAIWPIRADGSATFNDAVSAGASGIDDASTSMTYATMIANLAGQLNDGDSILFGSGGGVITATSSIIYSKDDITISGQADAIPTLDMGGLHRIKPLEADRSNHNNFILKVPNNSGIEWQSLGNGNDFTGKVFNVYVSGSSNQAFSVEPAANDTFHITADKVVSVNNIDDGWSMHTGATATVTNSIFSGNHQGLGCMQGSSTTMKNCVFLSNTTGINSADVSMDFDADGSLDVTLIDCYIDGNIKTAPSTNARIPTLTVKGCIFMGNYVSSNSSVDDAIVNLGTTVGRTINSSFDNCDFFRSINGKFLMLLRGDNGSHSINNCRISDTIKNTQDCIFTENSSTTTISNNSFVHVETAFANNGGATISNNNFMDVGDIGGAGATITGSTFKFPSKLFNPISSVSGGMIRPLLRQLLC